MKLNFYSTKDYENEPRLRAPGKQTQSKPISKAKKMLLNLTINGRRKSFRYYADETRSPRALFAALATSYQKQKATVLDENIGRLSSVMVKCAIISWGLAIVCKSL